MKKCAKIKNPCKICLGQVSEKNGLQCHGACKTWVHFDCLNYTPGQIKDIKAGIIKVTCPCPDCKTTLPKEYRIGEPFNCKNVKCPANIQANCGNITCPINKGNPNRDSLQAATEYNLDNCGKSCKKNSCSHLADLPQGPIAVGEASNQPFAFSATISDNCQDLNVCTTGCMTSIDIPGDFGKRNSPVASMGALEQMCITVGQLTNQINSLMAKMKQGVQNDHSNQRGCPQGGPRSICPKPCFCPENPGRG